MASNDGFVGGDPTPGPLHPDRQLASELLLEDPPEVTETFATRKKTDREQKIVTAFTTVTGYREEQIIGVNERTLTVVTANGGKYQLNKAGNLLRHLSGPAPLKPRRKKIKGEAPAAATEPEAEE